MALLRALGELRDALKTDDGDVISKKMELLTTASHKLAEEMYKAQAAAGGSPEAPAGDDEGGAAPDEPRQAKGKVVDAEGNTIFTPDRGAQKRVISERTAAVLRWPGGGR